ANDLKSCRLRIDDQHGSGRQRATQSPIAGDIFLGKSGDIANEESHARDATDRFHKATYVGRALLVPEIQIRK
ncbi:MAG TPA: hypothetical protein VGT04_04870, partial [Acidobacteriaceae bacterium]|nr:hypothetical protein [Acidobacteriaceae bacterium]